MSISGFKKLFDEIAVSRGWASVPGGWIHVRSQSDECLIAIELQKSSHGKQFYVNIKIFVDGVFGYASTSHTAIPDKPPTLFRRQPKELDSTFDLTNTMNELQREELLLQFFEFLHAFSQKAKTRAGVLELCGNGLLHAIPSVRKEVEKLIASQNRGQEM